MSADLAHSANARNAPEREHRSSAPERRAVAPWATYRTAPLRSLTGRRLPRRTTARAHAAGTDPGGGGRHALRDRSEAPRGNGAPRLAGQAAAKAGSGLPWFGTVVGRAVDRAFGGTCATESASKGGHGLHGTDQEPLHASGVHAAARVDPRGHPGIAAHPGRPRRRRAGHQREPRPDPTHPGRRLADRCGHLPGQLRRSGMARARVPGGLLVRLRRPSRRRPVPRLLLPVPDGQAGRF